MPDMVPAGLPASVEVTYQDPALNVGVEIWDDSGSSPVQVTGLPGMVGNVLPLLNFRRNSYRFQHQGVTGHWYIYSGAVFTDGTFSVVDTTQPQFSKSLFFASQSGGGGGGGSSTGEQNVQAKLYDDEINALVYDEEDGD